MMEWLGQEWDYAAWSDSTKEAAIFGTVEECVAPASRAARGWCPEADLHPLQVPSRSGRDHRSRDHPAAARQPMKRGDREILLIVDVQNDFCPGGALAVPQGDEIVPAVNRLAAEFRPCDPDPGLAPARTRLVRQLASWQAPFRLDRSVVRPADLVAGPLRAGDTRGRVSPRSRRPACRARAEKGLQKCDQLLLGVPRKRPSHADRTRKLSEGARVRAHHACAGSRLISACSFRRSMAVRRVSKSAS